MKYQVVTYMRIDPEDPEFFETLEEAEKERDHLESMEGFDNLNEFLIEEIHERREVI